MWCEIYLATSSLATCIRQSVYDSEVLSINQLRFWDIYTQTLAWKRGVNERCLRCMSFGHASNGPDFDTDMSRIVNLVRLIALSSLIYHCFKGSFTQVSCLRHILAVLRRFEYSSVDRLKYDDSLEVA